MLNNKQFVGLREPERPLPAAQPLVEDDVLDRMADLPQTRLHELLPWSWKADRQQALAA